jgi:choline dehydrogenase-like flavoprotein
MGQYIAQIKINDAKNAYVSLTHGTSIPTSDIVDLLPLKNNFIYSLVNFFKKHLVVAMIFYSSEYSNYKIQLGSGRFNFVDTKLSPKFKSTHQSVLYRLKSIMKMNYLYTFPFLSSLLPQGSDIHYGGTIPIGLNEYINCTEECEIRGFQNLYVVDGSWMPLIPEKAHTFTIIANSIRVADHVATRLDK